VALDVWPVSHSTFSHPFHKPPRLCIIPASMSILLIAITAFLAGAVNAMAGGGTFLAFPMLTGVGGLSEKAANISCTLGLWPGAVASVVAARSGIRALPHRTVIAYAFLCLIGGAIGSELLLQTSVHTFSLAIPWLLAFATGVFAFGKYIARWAGRTGQKGHSRSWIVFVGAAQFVIAIYGGYFGAGIGVLTLAGLSLTGIGDLRQINAMKVVLTTAINLAALIVFLFGPVPWIYVGPMAIASAMGGFVGMMGAQRMPQALLRTVILLTGIALTAVYFWKTYGPHA